MKRLLILLLLSFFFAANLHAQQDYTDCEQRIDDLIDTALKYIGVQYDSAGSTPRGFDCSGFICYVYSRFGVKLPRHSGDQWKVGEMLLLSEIKRGDLVYFVTQKSGYQKIGHVGMAVSDYDEKTESFKFIHANSTDGYVNISDFKKHFLHNQYGGARRFQICN